MDKTIHVVYSNEINQCLYFSTNEHSTCLVLIELSLKQFFLFCHTLSEISTSCKLFCCYEKIVLGVTGFRPMISVSFSRYKFLERKHSGFFDTGCSSTIFAFKLVTNDISFQYKRGKIIHGTALICSIRQCCIHIDLIAEML